MFLVLGGAGFLYIFVFYRFSISAKDWFASMLTRIQARHFRSLKTVDTPLSKFQALVGPNASGKTTFLDVVGFMSDLMQNRGDVLDAVQNRSTPFEKLLWRGEGESFQIAVEAEIPERIRKLITVGKTTANIARYELEIGINAETNEIGINRETLWLGEKWSIKKSAPRDFFPGLTVDVPSILQKSQKSWITAINKKPNGNDNYYPQGKSTYKPSYKLGRTKSALAHLPADSESFPASSWFKQLLEEGVQTFVLNSQKIRQPSPPGLGRRFQPDGSNLPWVIAELRKNSEAFALWLAHVRTALEDVRDIKIIERPEDKHSYLVIEYDNGAQVPSWLVSDGTLRLLALTIPAYLPDMDGTFLIEEPENGIHPRAIETVLQSLASIQKGQVIVATHSPIALNILEPKDILCFAKDSEGATDIVCGNEHPALRSWKEGAPELGVLFASGVLS